MGLDGTLAPNCILLVKWGEAFSRLRRDPSMDSSWNMWGKLTAESQTTRYNGIS